jgi:hypothetical protein
MAAVINATDAHRTSARIIACGAKTFITRDAATHAAMRA